MSGYAAGFNGSDGRYRRADSWRGPDAFDPAAIVIDPQVPGPVQEELRSRNAGSVLVLNSAWPAKSPLPRRARGARGRAVTAVPTELVGFRDQRPEVPDPPRSLTTAARLAAAAAGLLVVSIIAGVAFGTAAFTLFFVLALGAGALAAAARDAAKRGRPAIAGGLFPLGPASDLTEYHVMYAGRIFHRRYVRPRVDLDSDARITWQRAVTAANQIYRSDSLRDRAVDADRVNAEVPELLWKIAEGLAMLSDVRFDLRQIVPGRERGHHPAVEAKVKAQERQLARGTSQVDARVGRLEVVASRLAEADAARRDEALLKRLGEVDPKIHDLVASTDESVTEIDMAEGLKLDVEAIVEMTNQAIRDLAVRDEDDDPTASRQA